MKTFLFICVCFLAQKICNNFLYIDCSQEKWVI